MIIGTVMAEIIYYDQPVEVEIRGRNGETYLALAISLDGFEGAVWMIAEVDHEDLRLYLRNMIEVRDMFEARALSKHWGDFWGGEGSKAEMLPLAEFPADWLPPAGIFAFSKGTEQLG